MKYDRDLISTLYILQQTDLSLAERMWNRLISQQESGKTASISLGYGLTVSPEVVDYIKRNHSSANKVAAIKAMREQTGWGLKDAKDAVDTMIMQGILR